MRERAGRRGLVGRPGRRLRIAPRLEALEARRLLANVFVVDSTSDDNVMGTLRWAIDQANTTTNSGGPDEIHFAISGAGPHTIAPQTPLPVVTDAVLIDGNTQGVSATPLIVLDGTALTGTADGIVFSSAGTTTASSSTVRGLAIGNFPGAGIAILSGADNVIVQSNFVGTDATGQTAQPNGVGVAIRGSDSNTIGGLTAGQGNLISGNAGAGLSITGAGAIANVVQANTIGLALDGSTALANQGPGILIAGDGSASSGARNNTIGGALDAARNIISGNAGPGIRITDGGATGNQVQHNYIGTNSLGTIAVPNRIGVQINGGAASNTIGGAAEALRNVISGNTTAEVFIDGASSNTVAGNFLGTIADGTAIIAGAQANTIGVLIQNEATNNTIGGVTANSGNVIAGHANAPGVWIRGRSSGTGPVADGNLIQGNTIGAATGGATAIPNLIGIQINDGATDTTIGGTNDSARNIISGNTSHGLYLASAGTTGTVAQGNLIGVAGNGTSALANGGNGVLIDGASATTIGGTVVNAGNTIANNALAGIRVLDGVGNAFRRNLIFDNGGLEIDLGPLGVTPNDDQDPDPGPNLLQNFPVLTSALVSGGGTIIAGTLNSIPSGSYTIEFYSDTSPDPSGHGGGRVFLGSTTVTTDTDGNASFNATVSVATTGGAAVSAIAIAANGDTSEFAQNITAVQPEADLSITKTAAVSPPAAGGVVPTSTFVTYTITVTNNGPDAATTTTVTDTLPDGVFFVGGTTTQGTIDQSGSTITINVGTLAKDATATITLTIVSPSSVPSGGTMVNTAKVTSDARDDNPDNDTATVTSTVVQGVDLRLTKVVQPGTGSLGSTVSFILTVTNRTAVAATDIVLTDILPAGVTFVSAATSQGTVSHSGGVVTANLGTLPPSGLDPTTVGSSAVVTIVVRPGAAGRYTNTATVSAAQPQTVAGDNAASQSFTVREAPVVPPAAQAPRVTQLQRFGVGRQPSRIVLNFDAPLNAGSAVRLSNYRLLFAGRDGKFGTPDDRLIALRSADYDADARTVTLTTAHPFSLHAKVRLRVNGRPALGVRGTNGVFLNGGGRAGTDLFVVFSGRQPVVVTTGARALPKATLGRALARARG
jgi:uncharacterized repeat protein (TIGR01451 family)